MGQTSPPSVDGTINQPPLAQPVTIPSIVFGGDYTANVAFLGAAAYEVARVSQLNITLGAPIVPVLGQPYVLGVQIGMATPTVYVR